jgi:hypothetical protein
MPVEQGGIAKGSVADVAGQILVVYKQNQGQTVYM